MVGKYTELADAYMSLNEALRHGGLQNKVDVNINYIDSENLKSNSQLKGSDAILIPGGFGHRGINGMIMATNMQYLQRVTFLPQGVSCVLVMIQLLLETPILL